ncbi:MAG: hypothetical protein ACRD6R_13525 [Candidatus Polarisedimenticolia bacterium]
MLKISPRTIQYKVKQYRSGGVTAGPRGEESGGAPEAGDEEQPGVEP